MSSRRMKSATEIKKCLKALNMSFSWLKLGFFYTGVCGDSLLEQAPTSTSASPVRNMQLQMHKRD